MQPRIVLAAIMQKHDTAGLKAMNTYNMEVATRWWKARALLWVAYNKYCDKLGIE